MKKKYFIFAYDQAGFDYIKPWKDLDDDERDALIEEHGDLETAAEEEAESEHFWVVDEAELNKMREEIAKVLT